MSLMNYPMMGAGSLYDGYHHRGYGGGLYGAHMHNVGFGNGYRHGFDGLGDFGYGSHMYGMPFYGNSGFGLGNMQGYGHPYYSMGSSYYDNPYGARYGYGYNGLSRGGLLRRSLSLGSMRHGRFY